MIAFFKKKNACSNLNYVYTSIKSRLERQININISPAYGFRGISFITKRLLISRLPTSAMEEFPLCFDGTSADLSADRALLEELYSVAAVSLPSCGRHSGAPRGRR